MKTVAKRFVIALYCHDLISSTTVVRLFSRINLKEA